MGHVTSEVLPRGHVHIWWLSAPSEVQDVDRAEGCLSGQELARARGYQFERDRSRFVLARGFLRSVLGRYSGEDPARVDIGLSAFGKPFLANHPHLHFNLSHSGDRTVLAVASRAVGVDLERTRVIPEMLSIAERFFAAPEVRALSLFPAEQQPEAFLRCWTRKEAFVKAAGKGLSLPLDSFAVGLDPESAELVLLDGQEKKNWQLHDLDPGAGWMAALAVDLESAKLVQQPWP